MSAGLTMSETTASDFVATTAANEDMFATASLGNAEADCSAYKEIMDDCIIEWGRGGQGDDEFEVPTRHALRMATFIVDALRRQGIKAPSRVYASGVGGIDFEWTSPPRWTYLEIRRDGAVDLVVLSNGSILLRKPLSATQVP